MGREKARVDWDGLPMIRRVADALSACVERVRLVTRPGADPPLELECITDRYSSRAPIVGIHAALTDCESTAVLVASCDILLALVPVGNGHDVVAAVGSRGPEPLCAIYRPALLPEIARRIEVGELALAPLLRDSRALLIPEQELRALDPELRSFHNVNRPEDLH
jgi:molybdopterin-guanine dinucleotide biosynthesis protein A